MTQTDWRQQNPDVKSLMVGACDLNGILRGKRVSADKYEQLIGGGIRMPRSAVGIDVWGVDVFDNMQVFDTGDGDAVCVAVDRSPLIYRWRGGVQALVQVELHEDNGSGFGGDPRVVLGQVLARYAALGLTPVVATELEFYLTQLDEDAKTSPLHEGQHLRPERMLDLRELDDFSAVIDDIYAACEENDIPADSAISESGLGQLEINLLHSPDALKAADDAIAFKQIVKGVAQAHGLRATFMAKPFGDQAGSGLHTHFSILDRDGNNIFDNGTDQGSAELLHAVAGLLNTMADFSAVFAPNANSYRRLRPRTHAPTKISWGYENRTAAIRIPGGSSVARRIEHRVAGADANPYLVLAAVLGGALHGIEQKLSPSEPIVGNAYEQAAEQIESNWEQATERLAASSIAEEILGTTMIEMFSACKRQEIDTFGQQVSRFEHLTLRDSI
ncbi:MAG: glutamine synthetase [Gammaproteobacteria bacterium]|nr:glutamine synthetase [Gammaproteobacteria bacterium]